MKRTCIQCNKEFELTQSEMNFYRSKKLHFPKRCKECRALNKAAKGVDTDNKTVVDNSYPEVSKQKVMKKKTPIISAATLLLVILAFLFGDKFPVQDGAVTNPGVSTVYEETEAKVSQVSRRTFRKEEYLQEHYEKHGIDMGFVSAEEYLAAANKVLENEDVLHKIEAEDGDNVYYLEATNEFVIVSTDGYIRTYFYPEDGIDYFNRQ